MYYKPYTTINFKKQKRNKFINECAITGFWLIVIGMFVTCIFG